jgi:hypothetical protein
MASIAIVTSTKQPSQCNYQKKDDIRKCAGYLTGQRILCSKQKLISFGLNYFFATIVPTRADVVTQMRLSRRRLNRQRRISQKIVRAMHAAFGWGLLILLNCHDNS